MKDILALFLAGLLTGFATLTSSSSLAGTRYQKIGPAAPYPHCEPKKFELSSLEIELDDEDYLKTVMGFSYGDQVANFMPLLRKATSNFYYQEAKDRPYMTFFIAEYKSEEAALKAESHLKSRWTEKYKKGYRVLRNQTTVTWFANNRLDEKCFSLLAK